MTSEHRSVDARSASVTESAVNSDSERGPREAVCTPLVDGSVGEIKGATVCWRRASDEEDRGSLAPTPSPRMRRYSTGKTSGASRAVHVHESVGGVPFQHLRSSSRVRR